MTSLFATPTPGNGATDAPNWTLGTRVEPKVAGTVSAVRWYMRPGLTGTVGGRLYNADTQALLASAVFGSTAEGWQSASFAPVLVTGLNLIAAVYTSVSGHYPFDTGIWPVENTDLLAPVAAGRFHASGDVFAENGTALCFYVDVTFTPTGSAVGSGSAVLAAIVGSGTGKKRGTRQLATASTGGRLTSATTGGSLTTTTDIRREVT